MVTINTPAAYIRQPGIISEIGVYAQSYKHVLIIGGKTALKSVTPTLFDSLAKYDVKTETYIFEGYATRQKVDAIVANASYDAIIGVGGGSTLDVAKAAAEFLNIPIITVPTIAATCAAWSALSVFYNDDGEVVDFLPLKRSPQWILADTNVLVAAPARYLRAGIADTLVKWYEFIPYFEKEHYYFGFELSLHIAKLAIAYLEQHSIQAALDNEQHNITESFNRTVDAVLALAGFVGSVSNEVIIKPYAHEIHNKLTYFHETHHALHGEKVIFGALIQYVLEGKDEETLATFTKFLATLKQPITLKALGLGASHVDSLVKALNIPLDTIAKNTFQLTEERVKAAIFKADALGQQYTSTAKV